MSMTGEAFSRPRICSFSDKSSKDGLSELPPQKISISLSRRLLCPSLLSTPLKIEDRDNCVLNNKRHQEGTSAHELKKCLLKDITTIHENPDKITAPPSIDETHSLLVNRKKNSFSRSNSSLFNQKPDNLYSHNRIITNNKVLVHSYNRDKMLTSNNRLSSHSIHSKEDSFVLTPSHSDRRYDKKDDCCFTGKKRVCCPVFLSEYDSVKSTPKDDVIVPIENELPVCEIFLNKWNHLDEVVYNNTVLSPSQLNTAKDRFNITMSRSDPLVMCSNEENNSESCMYKTEPDIPFNHMDLNCPSLSINQINNSNLENESFSFTKQVDKHVISTDSSHEWDNTPDPFLSFLENQQELVHTDMFDLNRINDNKHDNSLNQLDYKNQDLKNEINFKHVFETSSFTDKNNLLNNLMNESKIDSEDEDDEDPLNLQSLSCINHCNQQTNSVYCSTPTTQDHHLNVISTQTDDLKQTNPNHADVFHSSSKTHTKIDHHHHHTRTTTASGGVVSTVVGEFVEKLLQKHSYISRDALSSAIQDCYGRFILNLPHEYLTNSIQLCFAIQEAYWWYDDYWFEQFTAVLPKLSMRNFGFLLCEQCPLLRLYFSSQAYASLMNQWREYCRTIPLKGAILVNNTLTKVLMVQGWRGGRWMFPRGKVDELEDDVACAVREVKEEIGVDVSKIINPHVYIETNIDEQPLKLYIIPGVLESTPFGPRKRKEIGRIRWVPLEDIPGWKRFCKKRVKTSALRVDLQNNECSIFNEKQHMDAISLSCKVNKKDIQDHLQRSKKTSSEEKPRFRFWNVHPFIEALVGWIHLLHTGSKPRLCPSFPSLVCPANPSTVSTDIYQDWEDYCNSPGLFSFRSPPFHFNALLSERHAKNLSDETFLSCLNSRLFLKDNTGTMRGGTVLRHSIDVTSQTESIQKRACKFLALESGDQTTNNSCKKEKKVEILNSQNHNTTKRVCLSSITVSQPAAAKPAPLPPLIDHTRWYRIPGKTSAKLIRRLQHPFSSLGPTTVPLHQFQGPYNSQTIMGESPIGLSSLLKDKIFVNKKRGGSKLNIIESQIPDNIEPTEMKHRFFNTQMDSCTFNHHINNTLHRQENDHTIDNFSTLSSHLWYHNPMNYTNISGIHNRPNEHTMISSIAGRYEDSITQYGDKNSLFRSDSACFKKNISLLEPRAPEGQPTFPSRIWDLTNGEEQISNRLQHDSVIPEGGRQSLIEVGTLGNINSGLNGAHSGCNTKTRSILQDFQNFGLQVGNHNHTIIKRPSISKHHEWSTTTTTTTTKNKKSTWTNTADLNFKVKVHEDNSSKTSIYINNELKEKNMDTDTTETILNSLNHSMKCKKTANESLCFEKNESIPGLLRVKGLHNVIRKLPLNRLNEIPSGTEQFTDPIDKTLPCENPQVSSIVAAENLKALLNIPFNHFTTIEGKNNKSYCHSYTLNETSDIILDTCHLSENDTNEKITRDETIEETDNCKQTMSSHNSISLIPSSDLPVLKPFYDSANDFACENGGDVLLFEALEENPSGRVSKMTTRHGKVYTTGVQTLPSRTMNPLQKKKKIVSRRTPEEFFARHQKREQLAQQSVIVDESLTDQTETHNNMNIDSGWFNDSQYGNSNLRCFTESTIKENHREQYSTNCLNDNTLLQPLPKLLDLNSTTPCRLPDLGYFNDLFNSDSQYCLPSDTTKLNSFSSWDLIDSRQPNVQLPQELDHSLRHGNSTLIERTLFPSELSPVHPSESSSINLNKHQLVESNEALEMLKHILPTMIPPKPYTTDGGGCGLSVLNTESNESAENHHHQLSSFLHMFKTQPVAMTSDAIHNEKQPSNSPTVLPSTVQMQSMSGVEDICQLAFIAFKAVNGCRERVGKQKITPNGFASILGLND